MIRHGTFLFTFKAGVLIKAVDIGHTERTPLIHSGCKVKTVSRIDLGLVWFTHGIMIAVYSQVATISFTSIVVA